VNRSLLGDGWTSTVTWSDPGLMVSIPAVLCLEPRARAIEL